MRSSASSRRLVEPAARRSPPFIAVLTGITDSMVASAPRIESALPAFLEFARGCVLVAHNAPFDIGFLRAACRSTGHPWPDPPVLDTARLARHVVTRDEARNRKLGTLARLFRSTTTPDHRALPDARATVDVLHALIERVGNLGVHVAGGADRRSPPGCRPRPRRKRHLAESLPHAPGVYLFRDDARPAAVRRQVSVDIRTRVRSYFTAAERAPGWPRWSPWPSSVSAVVCATPLEAEVRELRLIAEHKPRYNRRSRFPERAPWVKLTVEPFPRLSVVREVRDDGGCYLGPFGTTAAGGARGRRAARGVPAAPVHPPPAPNGRAGRERVPAGRHRPLRRALRRPAGRRASTATSSTPSAGP